MNSTAECVWCDNHCYDQTVFNGTGACGRYIKVFNSLRILASSQKGVKRMAYNLMKLYAFLVACWTPACLTMFAQGLGFVEGTKAPIRCGCGHWRSVQLGSQSVLHSCFLLQNKKDNLAHVFSCKGANCRNAAHVLDLTKNYLKYTAIGGNIVRSHDRPCCGDNFL